jgi:hypothetical protein
MFAHIRARDAAVGPAVVRTRIYSSDRVRVTLAIVLAAFTLVGCMPKAPLAGADPAAKVAATGYRSTIAPYSSLRPSAPAPWREQNDRVAPAPKSGQYKSGE